MEVSTRATMVATVCAILYMAILYVWSSRSRQLTESAARRNRELLLESQKAFDGIGPVFVDESSVRDADGESSGGGKAPRFQLPSDRVGDFPAQKTQRRPSTPEPSSGVDDKKAFDKVDSAVNGKDNISKDKRPDRSRFKSRKSHPATPTPDFGPFLNLDFQDPRDIFDRIDSLKARRDSAYANRRQAKLETDSRGSAQRKVKQGPIFSQEQPITPKASSASASDNSRSGHSDLFRKVRTRRARKPPPVPLVKTPGLFTKMTPNVNMRREPEPRRVRVKRSDRVSASWFDDELANVSFFIVFVALGLFLFIVVVCVCCRWNSVRRSKDGASLIPDHTPALFDVNLGYENMGCEEPQCYTAASADSPSSENWTASATGIGKDSDADVEVDTTAV